jgi:DNA-binding transcriptional MocR family regulator
VSGTIESRKQRLLRIIDAKDHLQVNRQQAGYSLWVKSSNPLPSDNVPWSRGEEFSFSSSARFHFRLSFMNLDDQTFERGVAYLSSIL